MALSFEHPLWLLAIPLAAVVALRGARRSLVDTSPAQRVVQAVLRGLLLAVLAAALAKPKFSAPARGASVAVMVDMSSSMRGDEIRSALALAREIAAIAPRRVRILGFAGNAVSVEADATEEQVGESTKDLQRNLTDINAAVLGALGSAPPDTETRIVLLTDGLHNGNPVDIALERAGREGARIVYFAPPERKTPEVIATGLDAPASVCPGAKFTCVAAIESTVNTEARLKLYSMGFLVGGERKVKLKPGANLFRFETGFPPEAAKLGRLRFECKADADTEMRNNTAFALVALEQKPKILIVAAKEPDGQFLKTALLKHEFSVDLRGPLGLPRTLEALAAYDLVIFGDVDSSRIGPGEVENLDRYVRDLGGGFIMTGGENTVSWYGSPLEKLLPVSFRGRKKIIDRSVAIIFTIDKSGSMGGQKIELAKSAIISSLELISPNDSVSVVAFDQSPKVVVQLASASRRNEISDLVSRIRATGGTNIFPALEKSYNQLVPSNARFKHIILLSDGRSAKADYETLLARIRAANITVSTIAIGAGADVQLLSRIASMGSGRSYHTNDPTNIPRIFTRETLQVAQNAVIDEPFLPLAVRRSNILRSIDLKNAPFLLGYVVTEPRALAEIILAGESGDPILARISRGLGNTAFFASDAKNRWAAEWLSWPGYNTFWAQLARAVMRSGAMARRAQLQVTAERKALFIQLSALEDSGEFASGGRAKAVVLAPDGSSRTYTLALTAPGLYETRAQTDKSGIYNVAVTFENRQNKVTMTRGAAVGHSPELARVRPDEALLKNLADATGGWKAEKPQDIFRGAPSARRIRRDLWPWFVTAAIVLFILDLLARRLNFGSSRKSFVRLKR